MSSRETEILKYEARLREAMLQSDVKALDELLAPDLIFTSHLGQLFTKQEDLEGHRSGTLKVESLTPSEETIRIVGDVAIVSVRVHILGIFAGVPLESDFRFTRVWIPTSSGTWQVIAAHSSIVT
jgi:ketosteroid isomerase-like protein